jgi:hypothetical protein
MLNIMFTEYLEEAAKYTALQKNITKQANYLRSGFLKTAS